MSINILDELKTDFLIYAQAVNNNRAFPDARDSLKPVQRAILWAMYDNKYFSTKPHVKSAKVDGEVLGKFSPHGSCYDAIVRLSQDWINPLPLISWHGANGSLISGNQAAASRYTECRLSEASENCFFQSINKNTVDFIDNYSEDLKWPGKVLPCIAPLLLVNGASGIGYTIANDWLPHNLNEVTEKVKEYVNTGKISIDNIYPDYPTGGVIVNKKELKSIYETGKGTVILRGKADIIGKYINITELPYQVYAEPFIQKIKDLVNAGTLQGIEDVCNKSDDNGLLIEIECSADPKVVLSKLYKYTDLQTTFSANQMALVNGIPTLLNLSDYINVYINHNISCLQREYRYDLNKANERLELVEGLLRALSIIDDVIKTIKSSKSSESARNDLVSKFKFTENQAKAIVDMRLGKLANLESTELKNEQIALAEIVKKCEDFLANEKLQKKEFLKRLTEFTKKYGWERRTTVCDIDTEAEKQEVKTKIEKPEEIVNIILTVDNKIKKVAAGKIKKTADIKTIISIGAKDKFILISNTGTMYKLQAKDIKLVSLGSAGQNLKDLLNDEIIEIYTGYEKQEFLFFITQKGLAKKIKANTVFEISKKIGTPIMRVDIDDKIIDCRLADNTDKVLYTIGGKEKELLISDFIDKGRGAGGVSAIKLGKKLNSFNLL